jgi:hypothetical protein
VLAQRNAPKAWNGALHCATTQQQNKIYTANSLPYNPLSGYYCGTYRQLLLIIILIKNSI